MGKPRPHKKKASKPREKSVLSAGGSISKRKMNDNENPTNLLEQATILLQTGQPHDALSLAQRALEVAPANSSAQLSALNSVAEIYVELGDIELAKQHFQKAVELDPAGSTPEADGGGAEKFLWLAQLSEVGGQDSVQWFEKGVVALRNIIQKWEEDAENRCEALITEALLVQPGSPEVLQTLASIRISQLREDDARAALSRSIELWSELPPEDPNVPDFAIRISLARLLMEVSMLLEALQVLERLILEDDQSVEAWYLGGWCLYLLAEKGEAPSDPDEKETNETPGAKRQASLVASREWLKQGLTLYGLLEYEDERLKEHSLELVQKMDEELGEEIEDDSNAEDVEDGEDWADDIESDSDHEMADSMDLVSAPRGESPPLKSPLVEVDPAEVEGPVATEDGLAMEGLVSVSQSEYETDSEGEDWETQSLYEDAIQMIRDDQLRDGSIPDACTVEEAIAFRKRLREIGKAAFVQETIARDTVTAKKLCTAFGILPPAFLEGAPDESYHPLLAMAISREFTRRQKLFEYNTIDDAVKLLKESKNIIVLTGAGISTSLGIPDFRSKDTGLYSQLEHLGLSDPQEVFDIQIFREDPSIFYSIAKDILPLEKKYSPTHGFIRLLQDKGKLLTNYTQNIDNIEGNAGVLPENMVQCHGSFAKATCVKCRYQVDGDEIYDDIKKGVVPECARCRKQIAEDASKQQGQKRKRNSTSAQKDRKNDEDSSEDDYEIPTPGVMKPDITFFGEDLPDEFGRRLIHHDRDKVDLVIVIGTSLKVAPVAEVPGVLPSHVPQIYISRTGLQVFNLDIEPARTMDYLIRFAQQHETFRRPEIQALANLANIDLEIISYDEFSPYCVVKLPNEEAARTLVSRSILVKDIFELWGHGTNYEELHADVQRRTSHLWAQYKTTSFKFTVETFAGKHTPNEKRDIIQSFSYVGFEGPITLKNPEHDFWVLEQYYDPTHPVSGSGNEQPQPQGSGADPVKLFLGRWLGNSSREVVNKYDLKKRRYISTTSMDAELSLVTANMACAAPGKLFYDPFVGTGSFCVAAAHFGALTMGSDIDGRSFRGKEMSKGKPTGVEMNFRQYGIGSKFLDTYTSDLTNTPLLDRQFLDGIVCDPPYGVREGLRVLGAREGRNNKEVIIDGVPAHYRPGYIAPKKPYGFEAMLNDILAFAARTLVTDGRLAMWMPTSNDEEVELSVPMHPNLEVLSVSVQPFTTWSRRLITYRRLPKGVVSDVSLGRQKGDATGASADELNAFRRKYFLRTQGPKPSTEIPF
ncbi:SIR2-domain-containing protein [Aspergillus californicus]